MLDALLGRLNWQAASGSLELKARCWSARPPDPTLCRSQSWEGTGPVEACQAGRTSESRAAGESLG